MTRALIVSHTTGYQLRAFNDAAAALGFELVFATDRCHRLDDPWQDHAIAVRFDQLDASVDAIVAAASTRPLDGVIAVGDRPVRLAARAAHALGLPWHATRGAEASTDKRQSRDAIASARLPSPAAFVVPLGAGAPPVPSGRLPIPFPVVLKPLGLSGSRGVIRADSEEAFDAARARIAALVARPAVRAARSGLEDVLLVEQYIEGDEFAIEGVMTAGALQVFAIFDKPDPLRGPFFEETIYTTPSRAPEAVQRSMTAQIQAAARALGLHHGPIHGECRVTAEGVVYVLEVAGRPIGGLCSRVLTFESGETLESVLLRHAVGESLAGIERESRGAAVMMIPIPRRGVFKGVEGVEAARAVPGVTDLRITAKSDQLLEPLPEAGSYLGFIFARGETVLDAERAVRAAHAALTFTIDREIAVSRTSA